MSTYPDFVDRAREVLPGIAEDGAASDLIVGLLARVLDLEGPPPVPDEEDEAYQKSVIKHASTNRGITLAETWRKGPWRCLLLHTKAVPQARHQTRLADGTKTVMVDSASMTAQRRIVLACRQLKLDVPFGECVVSITPDTSRTFVAWRRTSDAERGWNQKLLGDVDNYAKTVMDGLQKAGVIRNDRGVVEARISKVGPWEVPAQPLEAYQAGELQAAAMAGASLDALEALRIELGISKRLFREVFPRPKGERGRPATATGEERLHQVETLRKACAEGISRAGLESLRAELGAPKTLLRGLNKLRLKGQRDRLRLAIKNNMTKAKLEKLRVELEATPSLLRRLQIQLRKNKGARK